MSLGVTNEICAVCHCDFKTNRECYSCVAGILVERIQALEQQNAELRRRNNSMAWRDVEKLVDAARAIEQHFSMANHQALAEALKPFEQEKEDSRNAR